MHRVANLLAHREQLSGHANRLAIDMWITASAANVETAEKREVKN
jgi:hypothetical protein